MGLLAPAPTSPVGLFSNSMRFYLSALMPRVETQGIAARRRFHVQLAGSVGLWPQGSVAICSQSQVWEQRTKVATGAAGAWRIPGRASVQVAGRDTSAIRLKRASDATGHGPPRQERCHPADAS
jgi:hypothetical protein